MSGLLQKVFGRLSHYLRSLARRPGEAALVGANRTFWARRFPERNAHPGRFVLVEFQSNAVIDLCNATFAAIAAQARDETPLFLARYFHDRARIRVLRSYHPGSKIVFINGPAFWPGRVSALFRGWSAWRRLRTPTDILDFQFDGIGFGDLIYDNVLIKGYATIRRVDYRCLMVLYGFFAEKHILERVMARHALGSAILSHTIGLMGGVYSRYLVRRGVEVINRVGSDQILLKKYRTRADIGFYPAKPEPRYFEYMMNLPEDVVMPLAERYIDRRHSQAIKHIAVERAFKRDHRIFASRQEFCAEYRLDPAKPVVFVMLHAFNDHPHSHFNRRMLYRDYYDWFEKTLAIARAQPEVNWVFKEHPVADYYVTKDADLDHLFSEVGEPHVLWLNRRADFNAFSIRNIAHAILTCLGTAGMEYACFGIPCVLAGEAPFSGFGFTDEPASVAEYERRLQAIAAMPRLTPDQVKRAKLVMFFELEMSNAMRYPFCRYYNFDEVLATSADSVRRDAAQALSVNPAAEFDHIIRVLTDFLRSPNWTQSVDLDAYPFMAAAVERG
jgi:hypothetical protein